MSFCNNVSYNVDHEFKQKELALIMPNDLLRWMNNMTFGMEKTNFNNDLTLARSMTLMFWKKAIFFFMPN